MKDINFSETAWVLMVAKSVAPPGAEVVVFPAPAVPARDVRVEPARVVVSPGRVALEDQDWAA